MHPLVNPGKRYTKMSNIKKQRILLRAIFRACGGPTELEKLTGLPRQNFTNWQIRGKVPLLSAVKLSKDLGISKWGFNYEDFCEVDDNPISWEETVKSYMLPKEVIKNLLTEESKCQKNKVKRKKSKKLKK